MMSAILDPVRVVIGGGVAEAGELMLGPARAAYDKYLTARSHRPRLEIEVATMGNDAGIIGAAAAAGTCRGLTAAATSKTTGIGRAGHPHNKSAKPSNTRPSAL